ncbi:Protein SYG1-like protein [Cladobotryum mycophilum]|uniref:Protein SYG1-like protein n=1 Tax=Cladobotryum mycophilum TaxID=491253 RepID=A0ABR0SPA8_9HYPO
MKFAKELEREAVPEWRIKYLNYKAGKKHVKAVVRAINRATATPRSNHHRRTPTYPLTAQHQRSALDEIDPGEHNEENEQSLPSAQPIDIGKGAAEGEGKALTGNGESLQYGSFVATPPSSSWPRKHENENKGEEFELPSPAINSQESPAGQSSQPKSKGITRKSLARHFANHRSFSATDVPKSEPLSKLPTKGNADGETPSSIHRIISQAAASGSKDLAKTFSRTALARQSFDLVRDREREFDAFLESELQKVEAFYKQKEEQAGKRLDVLREQLHEMRNRRILEMTADERHEDEGIYSDGDNGHDKTTGSNGWVHPLKAKIFPPGPNSKAFKNMPQTPHLAGQSEAERRMDYVRRPEHHQIPYRTAKRKLKRAVLEFYRSLELLKSYALLNRTAFRKLNKKFDKAVRSPEPLSFVKTKVDNSWFVNSDVLEGHIKTVEDLYSRYFERGNQKLAAGKLRRLTKKPKDESGTAFLNGFLIGTGAVFTIQGLIYGIELLYDENPTIRLDTGYLLQIYGGYFLMLLLFSLFCINCYIWTRNKVNYPFIFEFDQRTQLDWRQLAEFPSFCFLIFGVVMWANFSRYGDDDAYLYYPVVLIFITVVMIFFPAPVIAYRSRKWFVFSHGRLLLAGLYPVEFRDFFLGDMYCSLSYAMANVELFFCLYAHHWVDPPRCNSTHSRLLGFFTTVPPIWRFLQCIRRYRDTGNIFPHLVNCGKYSMSILASVFLSVYRIHRSDSNLALFITFNIINGAYCALWDLFMDFSLVQPQSRHFYLRDITAFKRRWVYYIIMIVDPILRFSWIFYAIFTHDAQHSTIVSFMVGLMEVARRGMWALLRVENEHCANVSQYKASRDVPLPYRIEPMMDRVSSELTHEIPIEEEVGQKPQTLSHAATYSTATGVASTIGTIRRRAGTVNSKVGGSRGFSQVLAEAHKQDFERKRRPDEEVDDEIGPDDHTDDDDDDEEDGDGDINSFMDVRTPRPQSSQASGGGLV